MTSKGPSRKIEFLKLAISALSFKFPLPAGLSLIIKRDFRSLNQSEAYELLLYLVNACNKKGNFKSMGQDLWKSKDSYSKMSLEKFKKEILDAVKALSLEGREVIPLLKKSDLMVPYCPRFFNCCFGLASYALSFQLSCLGTIFWPQITRCSVEFSDEVMKYTLAEKEALIEERQLYHSINEKLAKDMEYLRCELAAWSNQKIYLESELNKLIDTCKFLNKDSLRDKTSRFEALSQASKVADDLSAKNEDKLKTLKELDENLSFLNKTLERKKSQRVIVDGKELSVNISYETRTYAEKENIKLFENGSLNLQGLITVVLKSFSSCSEGSLPLSQKASKLLDIKLPDYEPCLLDKLSTIQKKLEEERAILTSRLGKNLDEYEVNKWFEDFFSPVVLINFDLNKEFQPNRRRDPVVVDKKIEFIINSKNKDSRKADSRKVDNLSTNVVSHSNRSGSFNLKHLRRLSSSCSTLLSDDSPISTVRKESTKIWVRRNLRRRSRSSTNVLSGLSLITIATNESPNFTLTKKEHLSSTPKTEPSFECDKSISPICAPSYNGEFNESQQNFNFNRSSIVSNGSLSLSNRCPNFFLASYVSSSESELKSTFNSSGFFPEFSLDSVEFQEDSVSESINS